MDKIQHSRKRDFFMCQNMIFDQDISEHAKITYAYLSKCADDKEQSFPSYKKIGEKCSFSRSTAIKAVKELKAIGLLSSKNRVVIDEQDKARYTSNLYTIHDVPISNNGSDSDGLPPTPPPSSSDNPPLVADRSYPSIPGNHNKYPINNTHIINTHSIPQEKEREIDINEILFELETTHTIPYYLSNFPSFMETIIKQLSEWEYKYPKGYEDNFEQSAYNLLIEALTEMATSSKLLISEEECHPSPHLFFFNFRLSMY